MSHRLGTAAAVLALLVSAFALHPTSTLAAGGGACVDGGIKHAGSARWESGKVIDTVAATIDVYSGEFKPCTENVGNDGPLAWIGLQPSPDSSHYDAGIIQIGIVNCNTFGKNACVGTVPHFFWAHAGCNGTVPNIQNLGDADYAAHSYQIFKSGSNYIGTIDGIQEFSLPESDLSISCWSDEPTYALWDVETHDRGDYAGASLSNIKFTNAQYQLSLSSTWKTMGPPSTACYRQVTSGHGRFTCSYTSTTMNIYTTY